MLKGTQAEAVRFHDDKDAYTGVHAHGGPSTVDAPNQSLEGLLDRSDADVRGVKTGGPSVAAVTHAVAGVHISSAEEEKKHAPAKKGKKKGSGAAATVGAAASSTAPASNMQEVFA